MTIERSLLRDQVKRAVLDLILTGELDPAERINESALSSRLGVSRTPLREALFGLEEEGVVDSTPGKGFSIAPLSIEEAREVYPLVGALEGLAITTAEQPPDLERAREINEQMLAHQTDDEACRRLDAEFHRTLVAQCSNRRLLELLAAQRQLLNRYEAAYMRYTADHPDSPRTMATSVAEHEEILDRLAAGDRAGAAEAVDANWRNGMERLLEILAQSGGEL
jgi:DNA-binding GntR family transcriptional regulator